VRQIVPQMDRRDHQPVDERQLVAGTGAFGPLADSAPRSMTAPFKACLPRLRQLLHLTRQMASRDPREQPMCRHHSIDHDRHTRTMPPAKRDTSPAITHQLVRAPRAKDFRQIAHVRSVEVPQARSAWCSWPDDSSACGHPFGPASTWCRMPGSISRHQAPDTVSGLVGGRGCASAVFGC